MIGFRIAALAGVMLLAGPSFGVARAAELGTGLEWWNAVPDDELASLRGRENIVQGPGVALGDFADGNAVANDASTAVNVTAGSDGSIDQSTCAAACTAQTTTAITTNTATNGSTVLDGSNQSVGGDDSVNIAGDTGSGVVTIGDENTSVQGDISGDDNQVVVGDNNATVNNSGDGSAVGTSNLLGKATNDQTITGNSIGGDVNSGLISSLSIANNSGIITTMMNTGSQVNMSNATVVNVYMTP